MKQQVKDHAWWMGLVALLVALAGFGVTLTQSTDNSTPGKTTKTVTLHFDKSGASGVQTGTATIPAPVQQQLAPVLESGLKDQTPTGMSQEQINAAIKAAEGIKKTLPGLPTGGATVEVPGCRTEFINSYSSRHGVRPTIFTLHLTVSRNVPGWSDVNAIVNLFAHEEASSNFVLDGEGHCAYIVPIEQKAWTQAAGNPFSISVEVIDTGTESVYLQPAGMRQLRVIARFVNKQAGIPIRLGQVSSSCTPVRSGFVQHFDWGICGGGHVDIRPFPVPQIVKYLAAGSRPSKRSVWIKHRQADHRLYLRYCRTAKLRKANAKKCVQIRAHARMLDSLIRRGK
jgi:hypothetical protein